MSKLKILAGETALYGLGSILPRVLNFCLVWLHSRVFAPDAYGIYTNLYAWVAFLNIVYAFGMETAYFRFATREGADERTVFRTAQTFVVSIGLMITAIFLVFAQPIANYFLVPDHPEFVRWIALVMFIDAIVSIPFARLRLQKKALKFAAAKVINIIIVIALNVYFLKVVYDPSIGIGFPLLANLLANAIYLLVFAGTLITWRPLWNGEVIRALFVYAWPIMLMGLAGMTNEMYSRLSLTWWLPEGFYPGHDASYALGIFGVCFRFAVIMNISVQAFRYAAEPFFFSNAAEKDSPALFAQVNHYFIIAGSFVALTVVVHIDVLKYFIDVEYWPGLPVVPYLLFGYLFLGVYYNLSIWYKLTDRTYFGTIITVLGMAITLGLNYLLIPVAGYLGSSWATLGCYGFMAITSYVVGQRYYPVPYSVGGALLYLGLTVVLIVVSSMFTPSTPWLAFAFHLGLMVIYALVVMVRERGLIRPIQAP